MLLYSSPFFFTDNKPIISQVNHTYMKRFLLLLVITLFSFHIGNSQTTLVSGDVAVIYHLSETNATGAGGDRIGLALLRNISSGTTFKVTENGSNGTQLDTDEGIITLTATSAHSGGKVINITLANGAVTSITPGFSSTTSGASAYAISSAGDQTIVYTGTESSPTFIYSAHFNGTSWSVCNAGGTIGGAPPGLCGGNQSIEPNSGVTFAFGSSPTEEIDNNWYNGSTGFTNKAEALAAITNTANWSGDDNPGPAESAADAFEALGNILPVELVYFKGRNDNKGNLLTWATAVQIGFNYFDIEHSTNGLDFRSINTIKGESYSSQLSSYEYLDVNANSKDNYYRLKMVDLDGRYDYSNIIFLKTDNHDFHLSINPNPADNFLNIALDGKLSEALILDLLRMDGKMVKTITLQESDNIKKMDISHLNNGIYVLKSRNSAIISQKIIIAQ